MSWASGPVDDTAASNAGAAAATIAPVSAATETTVASVTALASAPSPISLPTQTVSEGTFSTTATAGLGVRNSTSDRLTLGPPSAGIPPPLAANKPAQSTMASGFETNAVWRVQPQAPPPSSHFSQPQPQPSRPKTKIAIVDTPASSNGSATPRTAAGFPSPGQEQAYSNPKFADDRRRMTFAMQKALPDAVRLAVRENWEKCLLGSDFHQAFVLNVSIHHAPPAAVRRSLRDFGSRMVSAAKHEIIDQMTPCDIDEIADRLLYKTSDEFLDKALDVRLKTIDAKRLINALARAERLGYEPADLVEEARDTTAAAYAVHREQAMPSAPSPLPRQDVPAPASAPGMLYCAICFRRFSQQSAYRHHVKGKICTRLPSSPGGFKFSCQHCGQGFATVMGLQYHNANKVCGDFGEPIKVNSNSKRTASTPVAPKIIGTGEAAQAVKPHQSSPVAPGPPLTDSQNGTPGLHKTDGAVSDPYSHLSPDQLTAMQEELREAEIKYGERMRQAYLVPHESERKFRLDALANSFGTRQSLIRKKYGVRLRMRRTKAEILAERDRMHYRTAAELAADISGSTTHPDPDPGSSRPPASRPQPHQDNVAQSSGGGGPENSWAHANRSATQQRTAGTPPSRLALQEKNVEALRAADVTMPGSNKRRSSDSQSISPTHKRVAHCETEIGRQIGTTVADGKPLDSAQVSPSRHNGGRGTAHEVVELSDSTDSSDDEDIPNTLP